MKSFYTLDPVRIHGQHDYASMVGSGVHLPQLFTARRLLDSFPDDFECASVALKPEQWRFLYQINGYPIFKLANPGFDPVSEITGLFSDEEIIESIRVDLVGIDIAARDFVWDVRQDIERLGADEAKGLWIILCCARRLDFNEEQYWALPWWQPKILREIIPQLPSWSVEHSGSAVRTAKKDDYEM
jgi:hypothetical protein